MLLSQVKKQLTTGGNEAHVIDSKDLDHHGFPCLHIHNSDTELKYEMSTLAGGCGVALQSTACTLRRERKRPHLVSVAAFSARRRRHSELEHDRRQHER